MQRTSTRGDTGHERESSSDDLAAAQTMEPPRRVRRTKTTSDDKKEKSNGVKSNDKPSDCVVHSSRPKHPSPAVSSTTPIKDRIYTHRLRKVDNIATVKPTSTGTYSFIDL